jgi:GH15 family glucan-1,4-alpha-glucosidase
VRGTLEAVRRELMQDGFVLRYRHDEETTRSTACRR